MLDNFREWLSDNLRYIILGLIILVILVLLFFGLKASGVFSSEAKESEKKTEQKDASDDASKTDDNQEQESDTNPLQKNAYPEINAIINTFYTAWGKKDIASMKTVTDNFDAADEAKVQNSAYIENYSNINTYTKKGMTDGSYVVFVSYDLKFVDITTPAPGLTQVYVETNAEGKYFIRTGEDDASIQEYISTVTQDQDVQELINSVQTQYLAAQESDEKLRQFEEELGDAVNTATQAADGTMLTVKEGCNVRAEANAEAEKIDELEGGKQVKKLASAENGWIQIEYDGTTGFVRGDLFQ